MKKIKKLLDCIKNIDYSQFDEDTINEWLDFRDCETFDSEWCRVNNEISKIKDQCNYTFQNQNNQIRKEAFFIVVDSIGTELADYVSDDFGLIFDSMIVEYEDEWLSKLIDMYRNGKICGNL
ncbi:MAG: hypothetical protein K2K66_09105 [Ruminococcus sp.]|nr:hypothetical protein [Ruminococcus sp.]MDE6540337.1 hypothetical protein [Ruminococcus sp.]